MKPGDIYHAKSGKVFKVVPDLAYIMNRENPRCIGCYFNGKKDPKDPDTLTSCTPLLEQEGVFNEGEWEYCVGDVILVEVTDENV